MKRWIKTIGITIFIMLLLTACTKEAAVDKQPDLEKPDLTSGFSAGTKDEFTTIAENDRLLLSANLLNGEIFVRDKKNGKVWYSNPVDKEKDMLASGYNKVALFSQVLLTYSTNTGVTMNVGSFMGSVAKKGLTYRIDNESIIFKYEFVKEELVVPVRYSITNEEFVAEILTAGVQELGTNQITVIDLLPFFGAGSTEEEGYHLVPDGSGALIYFNNGKTSAKEYEMKLYGYDYGVNDRLLDSTTALTASFTLSENAYLPVFGEKCNEDGFIAILTDGAARASIKARTSGKYTNYNNVWSTYNYRTVATVRLMQKEMEEKSVSIAEKEPDIRSNYKILYRFLEKGKADYSDMANAYRDYLIDTEGLTAKTKEGDIPFYLDLYGYIRKKKSFFGIPKDTLIVTTSISDSMNLVDQLSDAGVNHIILKYNYWMKDGYYGKIPVEAKTERKLGGNKEMLELQKKLESMGGSLYLSTDLINIYKTGKGVSKYNDVLNSVANTPQMQYKFEMDSARRDTQYQPWYLLKPSRLPEYYNKFTDNFWKNGFHNVAFDTIGTMAYSDLSSSGMSRSEFPALVNGILGDALEHVDNIMLTGANGYGAVKAAHILNAPMKCSNYDVEDSSVPFFQLVFHGYAYYSLSATNLSSNPEDLALKCLEYGASPMYSWVGRGSEELIGSRTDYLFSSDYTKWMEFAAKEYTKVNEVLKNTATLQITSHRILEEGVTETVYGDSFKVIVNYNNTDVTIKGQQIRAKDYLVIP